MKNFINNLKKDKILLRLFIGAFLLIIIVFLICLFSLRNLPPFIPLYNQLPWGDQRLSLSIGIFIPPIVVLTIAVFNLILSSLIYKSTPLVSRMFAVTTFLISILVLLFTIRTVLLVL